MIKEITELNFPKKDGEQYATLTQATVTLQDMAEKTITSTVKIDGKITPDFSYDWEVEFKGEKYIMPLREPQGAKANTSMSSSIDLTFQHWAIYWLKQKYFFQYTSTETGTVIPDKWVVPLRLNLKDFCDYLDKVCSYWYGDKITIDFNDPAIHVNGWEYDPEPTGIDISYSYIWDVLIKVYESYAVRWQIEPNGDSDHYVIKIGYPTTEINHIFEYGFKGGLLKVERQVQDENIRNLIMGRGGEKNLPYRYFKKHDSDNASFSPDPDWVPELADIPFTELYGATFRSYIQGWKTKHYGGASVTSANKAYAPWAWMRGYTDTKFSPVEFVADEFTTESNGYGVNSNSSIAKYGELMGALENNEDIYPTMQDVQIAGLGRIDQTVAIEPVESDDIQESVKSDAEIRDIDRLSNTAYNVIKNGGRTTVQLVGKQFRVNDGRYGNVEPGTVTLKTFINKHETRLVLTPKEDANWGAGLSNYDFDTVTETKYEELENIGFVNIENVSGYAVNILTGETHTLVGLPAGMWRLYITVDLQNTYEQSDLDITVSCENVKLIEASPVKQWTGTWNIWVKNLWNTQLGIDQYGAQINETEEQYAVRVWQPILGDRLGNEAKVVFSDGLLSTSEDYEFVITEYPVLDQSKTFYDKNTGDTYISHWRITLGKSDADLKSTGLYLPSTKRQAEAGNHFFLIGIDMPHMYVTKAEERLDDWKKDELAKVKDIKPAWVVGLDNVRIHNYGKPNAIVDMLHVGNTLRLFDKRFMPGAPELQYIQSITYTYTEPTDKEAKLLPDVEIVLSDKYETSANPVATLQGDVSAIQRQLGSISNIEQIVRTVGDRLYLRKDGIKDRSMSPTEFVSLLTSSGFRSGLVGGTGWGFYKDENGNWVLETDRLSVRQRMDVNKLVINQTEGSGGTKIESAAQMEITNVVETDDSYICYFDQKDGSVMNLFQKDDIAYCNQYTPNNAVLKFYKRRIMDVGEDCIILTKGYEPEIKEPVEGEEEIPADTGVNGTGIPEVGDVVIQYGNYTIPERQYVKIRDIIGGGYERYIGQLDSVNTDGVEYYFVGRRNGQNPRWFIGNTKKEYAEYKDGKLTLKCSLSIESTIGSQTIEQYIKENSGADKINSFDYLKQVLKDRTTIDGGLMLSSLIKLGAKNNDYTTQDTYAGLSGIYDPEKKGHGIAAWFGGDLIDAEVEGNETNPKRARSLFRMDGTGYLADGRIKWNADGSGSVANGMLFWDAVGNVHLGSGIFVGESSEATLTSVLQYMNGLNSLFTPVNDKYEDISFAEVMDKPELIHAIRAKYSLYSLGDVSAFGSSLNSPSGSGGVSELSKLLDVEINSPTSGQVLSFDGTHWINKSISGGLDEIALSVYLSSHNYVTGSDVYTKEEADKLFLGINSTSSSAYKLATARKLWGQSFDGTADVSGNMTGVGTIQSTNYAIAHNYSDTWRDGTNSHPWYGLDHRYGNTGIYSTTLSDYHGLSLKTGAGLLCITEDGSVGIGTNTPAYKLDVNGSVNVSQALIVRDTLQLINALSGKGVYFEPLSDGKIGVYSIGLESFKHVFSIDTEQQQLSLYSAYIGTSLSLDANSVIYGSPTISSSQRIYLNHEKTVWVRYNASLNAIEASHAIVSQGDVAAFGATTGPANSSARKVLNVRVDNDTTINIPADTTDVIINSYTDGGIVTLTITGNTSAVELINIYVKETSAGDVTIVFGQNSKIMTVGTAAIIRNPTSGLILI